MSNDIMRIGQHTPAPVSGRYAEKMANTAGAILRPVGGFDTMDATMSTIRAKLDAQKRLSDIERSITERRNKDLGVEQTANALLQSDSNALGHTNNEMQLAMAKQDIQDKEDASKLGLVGEIATGVSLVRGLHDITRGLQDKFHSSKGGTLDKIGGFLGKLAPSAEKAWQSKKNIEARQKRIDALLADASAPAADQIKAVVEGQNYFRNAIGGSGLGDLWSAQDFMDTLDRYELDNPY